MTSRLFRCAELCAVKYNIKLAAGEPSPELINKLKDKLIELYDNFFNEERKLQMKPGVISMSALFDLKNLGEPNVNEIFDMMNEFIANIDSFDVNDLYKKVSKLLDVCNKAASSNVIKDYLTGYDPSTGNVDPTVKMTKPSLEMTRQLVRGFENRIKSVTKRLDEVKRILSNFASDEVKAEVSQELSTKVVDLPARTVALTLVERFLRSLAANKYYLDKDNWDLMFSDPRFRQKLVHLLYRWQKNKEVVDDSLINEIKPIVEEFRSQKLSNLSYLESGETFAPSTSTSVGPENTRLIDKRPSGFSKNPESGFSSTYGLSEDTKTYEEIK